MMFAGFVNPRSQIPDYFIWIYWINPFAWCLRALAINEYRHHQFDVDQYHGIEYTKNYHQQFGKYSLSLFDVQSDKTWLGVSCAALVALYVFFMWLSWLVLEHIRYVGVKPVPLSKDDSGDEIESEIATSSTGSEYGLVETPRGDAKREVALEVIPTSHERLSTPVTLAFKDLRYSVPNPADPSQDLELLKGISGFAQPGSITALMGSSGAGKTTLMDLIAGRKTGGRIQGEILLNGYEATELATRRATGYCEQMDIHSEASTFCEALTFSAFLRRDASVSDAQKFDSVEECLDLLDMRAITDQIIRGSSVEQMKRLTIGVELAAQPSVLFLDEPTSGLDARSAKMIMDGVRKVANTGRTVVCTIHQPSWEVFQVFDSLLLLKRGGETVYFGELGQDASELIKYFESVEGTAKLEDGYNPATWMLEVIGAGVGNMAGQDTDFVQIFNASPKKALLDSNLDQHGVSRPTPGVSALEFSSQCAASESTQAKVLIKRFLDIYWRTPSYNVTRAVVYAFLALVVGLSYTDAEYDTYKGINAGEGMLYISTLFIGVLSFNSVLPLASQERVSFYRERASQTYSVLWYVVGSSVAEIPYVFTSCMVYMVLFFWTVGFTGAGKFFWYWINTSLHVLLQNYTGQLLAYALPSVEVAAIAGVTLNSILFLFVGFNPPADAIPKGYKWLYYITPQRYSLAIISTTVSGDCPDPSDLSELACKPVRNLPPTLPAGLNIKGYLEEVYLMKHSETWMNFGIVIAFLL